MTLKVKRFTRPTAHIKINRLFLLNIFFFLNLNYTGGDVMFDGEHANEFGVNNDNLNKPRGGSELKLNHEPDFDPWATSNGKYGRTLM